MSTITPEVALRAGAVLGEGPTWDPATDRLLWVDILQSRVHTFDPVSGATTVLDTGQHVGAVKPRASGGLVVNLRDGVGLYDEDGSFRWLAELAKEGRRGNDAAVDSGGRLWAGTMRYDVAPGGGALYRIDPDGTVLTVLDDVTVSNGTGWSPDGSLMYYSDSPTRRLDVFDVDPATGLIANRRVFTDIPGQPDGLTVDADGCVWVAIWQAGRIQRYTPDGTLDRTVTVPVPATTACCFGGPDLRDLYITTAQEGAGPDHPLAGSLFVVPDAGQGIVSPAFLG